MNEAIDRRAFCLAAGCGALTLAGCGADGTGFPFTPDDGGAQDGPGGGDLAQGAAPDSSSGGANPDLSGAPMCSGKITGPLATSVMMNQAVMASGNLYVCRDAKGLYALTDICTHAGCPVSFRGGSNDFYCPCHASIFDFDGARVAGPAPRPLAHYACCLDGSGKVIVDTSKTVAANVRI